MKADVVNHILRHHVDQKTPNKRRSPNCVTLPTGRFVAEGVGEPLYVTLRCEGLTSEIQWMFLNSVSDNYASAYPLRCVYMTKNNSKLEENLKAMFSGPKLN